MFVWGFFCVGFAVLFVCFERFVCVLKGGVNWLVHFPLKRHPFPSPLLCSSLCTTHTHPRRVAL